MPHYINASGVFESDSRTNLYLSSGDTQCPIHHDGYENLLTVLDGTKEVCDCVCDWNSCRFISSVLVLFNKM